MYFLPLGCPSTPTSTTVRRSVYVVRPFHILLDSKNPHAIVSLPLRPRTHEAHPRTIRAGRPRAARHPLSRRPPPHQGPPRGRGPRPGNLRPRHPKLGNLCIEPFRHPPLAYP